MARDNGWVLAAWRRLGEGEEVAEVLLDLVGELRLQIRVLQERLIDAKLARPHVVRLPCGRSDCLYRQTTRGGGISREKPGPGPG